MRDEVTIQLELTEIETPRGLYWAKLEVTVEIFGRFTHSAAATQIKVLDWANDHKEMAEVTHPAQVVVSHEIVDAMEEHGLLDIDKVCAEAIAEFETRCTSREESYREELVR